MSKHVPVMIPTLCRIDHLRNCIESLKQCTEANETELYVALDYPTKESHVAGWEQIDKYLKTVSGFKDLKIIRRDKNYGSELNCRVLVKEVEQEHDAHVFSEDDNVFAPAFLSYMNWGIEKFRDDTGVCAICGYNFFNPNEQVKSYDYFRTERFSAWGFGTWRSRSAWDLMDKKTLELLYDNWGNAFRMMGQDMSLFRKLRNCDRKQSLMGDAMTESYMLLHPEVRVINPITSLVRNLGHDGTGEHCHVKPDIMASERNRVIDTRLVFPGGQEMTDPELLHAMTFKKRYNFLHKHPDLVIKYIVGQVWKQVKKTFS